MDDRLEKIIRENREAFDDKSPREKVWAGINKELHFRDNKPGRGYLTVIWKAAAIIFLFTSIWLLYDKYSNKNEKDTMAEVESSMPQLNEAEKFYTTMIREKKSEILKMTKDRPDLRKEFLYSLNDLDSMYTVLKKELPKGNAGEIADAMIMNLQLRIDILNKQLSILKDIQNKRKDENIIS